MQTLNGASPLNSMRGISFFKIRMPPRQEITIDHVHPTPSHTYSKSSLFPHTLSPVETIITGHCTMHVLAIYEYVKKQYFEKLDYEGNIRHVSRHMDRHTSWNTQPGNNYPSSPPHPEHAWTHKLHASVSSDLTL